MQELIPVSKEKEHHFHRKIQLEHPGLGSAEEFVHAYNENHINRHLVSTKEMKALCLASYVNLVEKGEKLIITTQDQAEVLGAIELLMKLQIALQMKEVAEDLIKASYDPDGVLCFKEYTQGQMYYSSSFFQNGADLVILHRELILNAPFQGYIRNNVFLFPIELDLCDNTSFVGYKLSDLSRLGTPNYELILKRLAESALSS